MTLPPAGLLLTAAIAALAMKGNDMLETELDKALNALEQAAQAHCATIYGDELDLSEDMSMDPAARIQRIAAYLESCG